MRKTPLNINNVKIVFSMIVFLFTAIGVQSLTAEANTVRYAITTVVGNGEAGFSGDGGPATQAALKNPRNFTLDQFGNIYVSDSSNDRIRKVDASTGIIKTIIGDGVRRFKGDGGPADKASIGFPHGIVISKSGDIYLCDTNNEKIRKVNKKTGIITTIAGNGKRTFSGDNGPAVLASIHSPSGIILDDNENVYFSDTQNNVIRRVDGATGIIASFAGKPGYSGDGGAALSADLNFPTSIKLDGKGNIYIIEANNNVIRKLTPM